MPIAGPTANATGRLDVSVLRARQMNRTGCAGAQTRHAIALIAGLIGSQGPEFAQQYRQRAGGALDELRRIVAGFDEQAASERLTQSEAVERLEAESDPLARRRGEDTACTIARAGRLQACGDLPWLVVVSYHLLADTQFTISSLGKLRPLGPSILYISARRRR